MRRIFNTLFIILSLLIFGIGCEPDSQLNDVKVKCNSGSCNESTEELPIRTGNPQEEPESSEGETTPAGISIAGNDIDGRQFSNGDYASSCADYLSSEYYQGDIGDGIYNVQVSESIPAFKVYCDMTEDEGGWTLVWSNLRGGMGKPFTGLDWVTATTTVPLFDGNPISADLESFIVYTGLSHYEDLAPEGRLRYQWSDDFGEAISHALICDYQLTENTYVLLLSNCTQELGSTPSGFLNSSGRSFQVNAGNDCDGYNSPFWYSSSCVDGSITGGGEGSTYGIFNGAYWSGSDSQWGSSIDGLGAGNGWIFIK